MEQKIRCPACGKSQAPPSGEGGALLCLACGQVISLAPPRNERAPTTVRPPEREAQRPIGYGDSAGPILWMLAATIMCVAIVAVCLVFALAGGGEGPRTATGDPHPSPLPQAGEGAEQHAQSATRNSQFEISHRSLPQAREGAKPQPASWPTTRAVAATVPTTKPASQPVVVVRPATVPAVVAQVEPPRPRLPIHKPRLRVDPRDISDDDIGQAIGKGVNFLLPLFENGTLRLNRNSRSAHQLGLNSLAVYALLQSGMAIRDDRLSPRGPLMRQMVSSLKELSGDSGPVTYARALRATVLALLDRPEDREFLKQDVRWLLGAVNRGAYTYDDRMARVTAVVGGQRAAVWDNSNSQYGLLGVWAAAEVGIEVPDHYWRQVENHWLECQTKSGQWDYTQGMGRGYLSMTLAGVASLLVTHDYLHAPQVGRDSTKLSVGHPPYSARLQLALDWLDGGDNAVRVKEGSHWGPGYTLYGLERVGLASGFKYFGTHDWYRELARQVVDWQTAEGFWRRGGEGGRIGARERVVSDYDVVETAFMLLFLSRGRHPIIMNKLRFDGAWANRPRDAANLARFATRQLERQLNWQVVNLSRDWHDWLDSPILYIASHEPPRLTEDHLDKIRMFAEGGGMILTQADGASPAFDRYVGELIKKVFTFPLQDVPADHELWTAAFRIAPADRPPLKYVTNGSRILLVHSPTDIALHWQQRAEKTQRAAFELGVNLFIYAAGKADLRNRLASPYIPAVDEQPTVTLKLAQLRYAGNWRPERYALPRLGRYLQSHTALGLEVATVDVASLSPQTAPVAHLTGTAAITLSDAERTALREYVQSGGVLVVDPCGGSLAFLESIERQLRTLLPHTQAVTLGRDHPLFCGSAGDGMEDVSHVRIRPYAAQTIGPSAARVEMLPSGKGCAIVCGLDVTTGLLGTRTWSILGYDPAWTVGFMRNVLLWTAYGKPEK